MSLDLTDHFRRFLDADPGRIHLAAHSHHYWPDAAFAAHCKAAADAALHADMKWGPVFEEVIPAMQRGIARRLSLADPDTIAVAPNTHDFVRRLLSCLPAGRPPRLLASDAEFHSFSRQAARLEEDGLLSVERVAAEPFETFSERFCARAAAGGHDMVFVSQVFFSSAALGPDLEALAAAVPDEAALLVIDGYHGFMALPTDLSGIAGRAFYMAGGYKYAMAGEGCCFLHCPPGYGARPRDTGWFAAFGTLSSAQARVAYGDDGGRFAGATFDPSGCYRMRAVFDWMDAIGLTIADIHAHVIGLQRRFLDAIAAGGIAPLQRARLVTPIGEGIERGHFLTFETAAADRLYEQLASRNILIDVRGDRIRFGFGCYHTEAAIDRACEAISEALSTVAC